MKAIFVIEMPTTCEECQFCGRGGVNLERYVCCLTGEHSEDSHLVGCPLRTMPSKEIEDDGSTEWDIYAKGRNDVINEILGETK